MTEESNVKMCHACLIHMLSCYVMFCELQYDLKQQRNDRNVNDFTGSIVSITHLRSPWSIAPQHMDLHDVLFWARSQAYVVLSPRLRRSSSNWSDHLALGLPLGCGQLGNGSLRIRAGSRDEFDLTRSANSLPLVSREETRGRLVEFGI